MQQEDGNIMQLDDDEDEETKVEIVHIKEVESTKPSKLTSFIGNETIMDIPVPENELSDSDGGDWITPSSIRPKTASTVQKQKIKVACITNDFAMQV